MNVTAIKVLVRLRDGFKCRVCGMTQDEHYAKYGRDLEVHRDPPGVPYSVDGCFTVCKGCHGCQPKSPRGQTQEDQNCRIPEELYQKLKELAEENDRPVSWEVRAALRKHIQDSKNSE